MYIYIYIVYEQINPLRLSLPSALLLSYVPLHNRTRYLFFLFLTLPPLQFPPKWGKARSTEQTIMRGKKNLKINLDSLALLLTSISSRVTFIHTHTYSLSLFLALHCWIFCLIAICWRYISLYATSLYFFKLLLQDFLRFV